ncbi:MAG: serine protease [Desulfobacteraceae bacterium]|nr:serine protease [Desulfobacteraceae bacterium]
MKSNYLITILITAVLSIAVFAGKVSAETDDRTIQVIPISGEINPTMAAFLKRALRDLKTTESGLVVIEIDTFGGRVDSALDMVNTLVSHTRHRTIAYVTTKAISAGALIALACNELYMRSNTTIGDCAPITYSQEGPKELGEKFQSPLRAQFRSLAKRNGYPVALSEAMVTEGMEVLEVVVDGEKRYMERQELEELSDEEKEKIESKKTIVSETELLTMDDQEAAELGFSTKSVSSLEEMLASRSITGYTVERIDRTWSESFAGLIGTLSPILMLIGLGALYTEIKSPGFGLPGILGILCLALVFMNQYTVGLADYTEMLFLLGGIVLLGFELFVIPGFGIAGIAGLSLIAMGMVLALQDFVIPDPSLPWEMDLFISNAVQVVGSLLFGFLLALLTLRFVLPRISRVIDGPYLETTLEGARMESRETVGVQTGDEGIALSLLRPAGKMKIGSRFLDVVTQGEYIEKGARIKVSRIDGNRIVVVKVD